MPAWISVLRCISGFMNRLLRIFLGKSFATNAERRVLPCLQ